MFGIPPLFEGVFAVISLVGIDWAILIGFFAISLGIGLWCSRQAGANTGEFFLSGRHMPWWLLGFSMVATTFSTDTPNLVADLVRRNGVAGNWAWWSFLITGMVTVFFYAKLWRRSGVLTDLELYEIRYSGKSAAFLRGFRAVYLGVFINVLIMATVSLAAIKIGETMLGWSKWQSIPAAMLVTVVFSSIGGFRGVILTDFLLFFLAMSGSVAAAWFALSHEQVGGLEGLLTHPVVSGKLEILPDLTPETSDEWGILLSLLIMPLTVQWWSAWYPGSEPGGGGYMAQRMLAAKNERHAVGAVLFFQIAHYALRPWPWIIVALASLVVYPTVADLQAAFPEAANVAEDTGYSAMLTMLPPGWLGLVLTSLAAAYMSTLSTHLNWGASYVVNDFWKRFIRPDAGERELVWVGRLSTLLMMVLAAAVAFSMRSAADAFNLLVAIGAGTGGVLLARWYWWRVNAWSEIVATVAAAAMAAGFLFIPAIREFGDRLGPWTLVVQVGFVTVAWVLATLVTEPVPLDRLLEFFRLTRPAGPGWKKVRELAGTDLGKAEGGLGLQALATLIGCALVYGILFGAGEMLYGRWLAGSVLLGLAAAAGIALWRMWRRIS